MVSSQPAVTVLGKRHTAEVTVKRVWVRSHLLRESFIAHRYESKATCLCGRNVSD